MNLRGKKCFPVKLTSKFYKSKAKQTNKTPVLPTEEILYKSNKSIHSFSACSLNTFCFHHRKLAFPIFSEMVSE